jgi:serine/threonine-protein kinase
MELFQQAINIDPSYAPAYAGVADCYIISASLSVNPREFMPKLKAAAQKALELDNTLAEAHASLATELAYYEFNFPGAIEEWRKAISLNPNYPTAHHWLGEFLVFLGRFEEGFAEYQRAVELDPLSLAIASDYGIGYYYARQYDRSIEQLKKTIDMDPNFVRSHFYIVEPYLKKGMPDAAFEEFVKGMVATGDSAGMIEQVKQAYRRAGFKGVAQLELDRRKGYSATEGFFDVTRSYLMVGNKEQALKELEREYDEKQYFVTTIKVDPAWDVLRSEPRFIALMKKLGFDQH